MPSPSASARWPSPIRRAPAIRTAGTTSRGAGDPAPKGPASAIRAASSGVAAPGAEHAVDPEAARRPLARALRREQLAEPRHRRLELLRRQAEAGRHAVPAAAPDQPFARQPRHRGAEVDAR